jgi:hypothetical protein
MGLEPPVSKRLEDPLHYYDFVADRDFFPLLLKIDRSIAAEAHGRPCAACDGKLDRADFRRIGYGLPPGTDDECRRRFSFCCRRDGCRKRLTPESVRFLRGKAYVSVVIVLMSACGHGLSPDRVQKLKASLNVSRQTIATWLTWWKNRVVPSPFWKGQRGRFMPALDETKLSFSLLEAFGRETAEAEAAIKSLLRFLAPFG